MKPRASRPVNASGKARLLATGSCVALLAACAGPSPFSGASAPYAGDVQPSTVRPASIADYPNLADVPARPADLPSQAERQALRDELERDRTTGQSVAEVPDIAADLSDVAANRAFSQPEPQVASSLSPEPAGSEQASEQAGESATGPLIVDAQGLAEDTQPLQVEELDQAPPLTVAEAELIEDEAPQRQGFFARLFGLEPEADAVAETAVAESPVDGPVNAGDTSAGTVVAEALAEPARTPDPNAELLLPQTEQAVAEAPPVPAAPSNGDLMIPQSEQAPTVAAPVLSAPVSDELMLPQTEQERVVAEAVPAAQAAPVARTSDELTLPQAEDPAAGEPVVLAEAAPAGLAPLPAAAEPTALEIAELSAEEAPADAAAKKPGFFARWFGGQGRQAEPAELDAPAADPAERVVIARLSSNDPDLAPIEGTETGVSAGEERIVVEALDAAPAAPEPAPVIAMAPEPAPVTQVARAEPPAALPAPVTAPASTGPAPMSQERARALIAAREQRDAGTLDRPVSAPATQLARAPEPLNTVSETLETQVADSSQAGDVSSTTLPPLVPTGRQASQAQIAALPDDAIMPDETVVIDEKSVAIASGPIDPTIRIFQERFAQSGVSVAAPIRVASAPAGSLTTDMPPLLPRLGVVYFRPGELGISQNQRPLTYAAATELFAAGGSLRVVAHRNAAGMPGDPDPADAARVRLQEVIAGLMASGVSSQSIVTEIASANNFYADMDYNRRVEIYLDSATPGR